MHYSIWKHLLPTVLGTIVLVLITMGCSPISEEELEKRVATEVAKQVANIDKVYGPPGPQGPSGP